MVMFNIRNSTFAKPIMRYVKNVLKVLMACWIAFWWVLGFLLTYPLLHITLSRHEWYPLAQKIRKVWLNWCIFWGFVQVEQIFEVPIDKTKSYVITPNHTSKLDMIVLLARIGIDFVYMAKEEFQRIPLLGLFFRTIDIPVDPDNPRKAALAYRRGIQHLRQGKSLAIYPEGTIARITPRLTPFKNGAFRMAIEEQVDVLPVTSIGHWELLSDFHQYHYKPGKVIQYVHKPISTKGLTIRDSEQLKQKVFDIIASKLEQHGYHQ